MELTLIVSTPAEKTHRIGTRSDEPLQHFADAFFAHARSSGMYWSAHAFCFSVDGHLLDYARTPDALGLADADQIDLIPYPAWHWMAHAPSAVLPCPDVLAPLLEVLGGWEGSGKLAQLNNSWRALVDEWRTHESRVELSNADGAALQVVALRCRQLRYLTIRGSNCSSVTDEALCSLVRVCPHLQAVDLESCDRVTGSALRCIAEHCPMLERLSAPLVGPPILPQSSRTEPLTMSEDDVERSAAEGDALHALAKGCTKLQALTLPRCLAPADGLAALFRGCTQLTRLELQLCHHLRDDLLVTLTERCEHAWGACGGSGWLPGSGGTRRVGGG